MALCGKVNNPAWRVPQESSCEPDGLDQSFPDPLRLSVGADSDRAEEPDTSPPCREIGPDQFTVHLRGKAGDVLGREPAIDIVQVGPEILRVGCAEKRAKGGAKDAPGRRQIVLGQRSNCGAQLLPPMLRVGQPQGAPAIQGAPPGATPRPSC